MANARQRAAKKKHREAQGLPPNPKPVPKKLKKVEKKAKPAGKPKIHAQRKPLVKESEKDLICFHCREYGHSVRSCPQSTGKEDVKRMCYNCGKRDHSLKNCPKPRRDDGTLEFASCFVCNGKGHIASQCPSNEHGIYPKGGCCKVCGLKTHLASDCPQDPRKNNGNANPAPITPGELRVNPKGRGVPAPANKRKVFASGDDLEDDFVAGDEDDDKGKGEGARAGASASKSPGVAAGVGDKKPKKAKVVAF